MNIKSLDCKKIHLIEVKPKFKIEDEKVVAKEVAAVLLAEQQDMIFYYWDEKLINSFGYKLVDIKILPYVTMREI